jgi:nitrate/TMAO reductase-like tetraheme cytochrome c subunit
VQLFVFCVRPAAVIGAVAIAGIAALANAAELRPATQSRDAIARGAIIKNLEGYLARVRHGDGQPVRLAGGPDDNLLLPASPKPEKSDNSLLPNSTAPEKSGDSLLPAPSTPASSDNSLLPSAGAPAKPTDNLLLPSGGGTDQLLQVPVTGKKPAAKTAKEKKEEEAAKREAAFKEHQRLFVESRFPSAETCRTCHPRQYAQWAGSQHAYAQLSPVFMAMQTRINTLTSNTNGDFCIRCHTPIGMSLGESIFVSNLQRPATVREGITCVVCHRVAKENYGKVSGRFGLQRGDIFKPVKGPTGNAGLKQVLNEPGKYLVSTSKDKPGRSIHADVKRSFFMTKPGFCGMCHDVTLLNGFRLEEAFSEYKQSPAAKRGVTCQDCHMGKVQGVAAGYDYGPAAIVGGIPTRNRRLTDHSFAGPDYSIIHPGLFPHNPDAAKLKTMKEWLSFNYRAGWGTDKFENSIPKGYKFPKAWQSVDDRYDARAIIDKQLKDLRERTKLRLQLLRNGFKLSKIKVEQSDAGGLRFSLDVINGTDGHAVPTGFDAERVIWLQVRVKDSRGRTVYVSGDRDPNGDVRDTHSLYVHDGKLPLDTQLFNLQSRTIVSVAHGGERDQVLAVPTSLDVLPFVRPEARPMTLLGRPLSGRKHKQTIEPGGSRTAFYTVSGDRLKPGGRYTITARLICQMVPVNLVAAIQGVGFDYGMSAAQVARAVVRGSVTVRARQATVVLK